jgi:hypothetical protein
MSYKNFEIVIIIIIIINCVTKEITVCRGLPMCFISYHIQVDQSIIWIIQNKLFPKLSK